MEAETGTAAIHGLVLALVGGLIPVHGNAVEVAARGDDTTGHGLVLWIGTGVETETEKENETGIEGGATRAADDPGRTYNKICPLTLFALKRLKISFKNVSGLNGVADLFLKS